jgi:hypothetical protein
MKSALAWCVVLVATLAVSAPARAPAAVGPGTIRITDIESLHKIIDRGRRGTGVGDVEIVRLRLYNRRITTRTIGRGDLVCTFVDTRIRLCEGAYALPRGKLVVSGTISSRLLFDLAVTGGTGLYDNARGSLTVTTTGFRPRREVLVFRLTG